MTIPNLIKAGDVAPFPGTGEEADQNLMTHAWEEVEQTFQPHIPEAWKKQTGIESFPKTTHRCVACEAMWFSQQSYYPCGKEVRLTEDLWLGHIPGRPKYSSEK